MTHKPPVHPERHEARIARVTDFIDANPAAKLSLQQLSSVACLSPFHFHRIFRAYAGEPLRSYVERRRLELAVRFAREGTSWKEAGARSGYASPVAFTRAFKRVFGLPPTEFELSDWWIKRVEFELAHRTTDYFGLPPPPVESAKHVELVERPKTLLAVVRVKGGYVYHDRLLTGYRLIRTWARRRQIDMSGGRTTGTALDYPAEMPWDQCWHALAVEVPDGVEPVDGIAVSRRDAGLWAAIRVKGDLAAVAHGWAVLFRTWLPGSGYRQRDVRQEEAYHALPEECSWASYDLTCYLPIEPDIP